MTATLSGPDKFTPNWNQMEIEPPSAAGQHVTEKREGQRHLEQIRRITLQTYIGNLREKNLIRVKYKCADMYLGCARKSIKFVLNSKKACSKFYTFL
jgi:hypothetical protein